MDALSDQFYLELPEERRQELYDLYVRNTENVREAVYKVNVEMGSHQPESKLKILPMDQFIECVNRPTNSDQEGARIRLHWMRRLAREKMDAFPEFFEEEEEIS